MMIDSVMLYLTFAACMLPAGIMSVVWEEISSKMTLEVSGVGILRAMIALGGVLACILADRLRTAVKKTDLICASVGLETLGVIGFSLARLFWHLCLWSFVLGFGYGLCLSLLMLRVHREKSSFSLVSFSGGFLGIFLGTYLLSSLQSGGLSWRTGCQVLGIVQILAVSFVFLVQRLRHRRRKNAEEAEKREREQRLARVQKAQELEEEEETDERQAAGSFIRRMTFTYVCALLCACTGFCMALWPQTYRVMVYDAKTEATVYGVLVVSLGMTAGCLVSAPWGMRRRTLLLSSEILLTVLMAAEAVLARSGALSEALLTAFQFLGSAAAGPVLPALIRIDDVRISEEAGDSLLTLVPAFSLGAWMIVTPVSQALVGAGESGHFAFWLFVLASAALACSFPACGRDEERLMPDDR